MKHPFGRYSHVIVPILIAITALIIYSNTFSASFHFDDAPNITENYKIRLLSNFLDFSGTRYIGELSFALNYYFGKLDVFGYHLVNIIIHIINGILVWWFVSLTFKTPVMRRAAISPQVSSLIALTASLIFISHPIQTQAVTYIVQRLASLATLFYLLSVVLFVKWRLSSGLRYRGAFYFFSLLSVVLAMKTKEMSFTLPFIILLYEFIFFRDRLRRAYFLIPYLLTLLIIPLTIIDIDIDIGTDKPFDKPLGDVVGDIGGAARDTERISRVSYLLTQFRVIVVYIRLLFLPVNQNLDYYDYPVYNSLFIPVVFLSFLFLLFIIGLGVYLFIWSRRSGSGYALLASFGIFWFFITLSVESSIIPIRDVIFEHRLYLPVVGAVIAFSSAVLYGFEYWKRRMGTGTGVYSQVATCGLLLIMVVPLSVATYQRNKVWKDELTLWTDVSTRCPSCARSYFALGNFYKRHGDVDRAIELYKKTLALDPLYHEAYNNLGVLYYKDGRLDLAIGEYNKALRIAPSHLNARIGIGKAYMKKGEMKMAEREFEAAIALARVTQQDAVTKEAAFYLEWLKKRTILGEIKK